MEKSTLKKGGIVLLGAMTLFGTGILSWADVTEQVNPPIEKKQPGWTKVDNGKFSTKEDDKLAENLRNYVKVDLTQAAKPSHDVIGRYCSMFDFSNLGVDLLPGLAVSFANTNGNEVVNGIYQNWTYDEVKNHEPIKKASVFKVGLDEEGSKYGLGIYPDYASNARVEFVYSTRGLTDVNRIQVKLNSYGDPNEITVSRTYTAKAAIYNLDGTKVKDLEYGNIYVADKEHVGQPKEWNIQTSNVTTDENLKVNDLDNKIIRVVITSENPVQKAGPTSVTEPLLVISDVHIDFNRPEVTLDAPTKDNVLQAGAGRTGDCKDQTLETTVKFWNSLDVKELGLEKRYELYGQEGNQLSEDLRFEGERPTFYEVSAAHPFRLHTITISDVNDPTKVSDPINLDELAQSNKIGKDVVPFEIGGELAGQDSLITYRIPREYFEEVNPEYDEYKVSMTYAFEPLTVGTFEDEYIKATTSARSTDTATVVLKGNSIPTFKAVDELTFTKYREVQYADAIEFTNLPNFGMVDGGFYMQHDTKADQNATQRYDDDIVQIGWRVVYGDEVYFIRQKDSRHILPATAEAPEYEIYDYDAINWNLNTSIALEDAIFPGEQATDKLEIIDCTGNLAATSVHPVYRCVRKDVNISNSESLNPIEKFTLADDLTYQPLECKYSYTGADLKAGKAGAVYEDLIVAKCAQAFIWYRFEGDSTALGGAMLAGAIDKLDLNTGRVDLYFSGYHTQALGDARMKSREHTIRIFAGENVQTDENGIAVIKVFKEKFNIDLWAQDATEDKNWLPADGISNKDDSYEHTKNGFFFTYNAKQQYVTASWDATSTANDAGEKWRGQNVTDTLYIRVDLSTPAMQAALKEDGIPVQVVYSPYDERYTFLEGLHDLIDHKDLPFWANTLNHVAQFGIVTGNAYNEFYTVGSTSKGLITTMITDRSIASYANFADFVNNRFGDLPNGNIHGIYKDYYAKDHGSYYVGSECLNGIQRDHNFIIAGLNLINDVDLYTYAAAPGAFTLNVMPILGTVSEDGKTLTPNEYGEALFVVSSEFAPKAEDKAAAVVENITVNKDLVAMNYLKDTVVIKPVQTAGHDSVFVYDLDKENHAGYKLDGKLNLFNHYAAYRADSVETVIKGDVRVPELWLSSDKEGKEKIASIPFGEIVAGEEATQTIYVQGIDLPLSKDDPQLDGNVIDAVLPIITDGIYTSDEEIDILTAARENKAEDGSISGAIAKAVEITATPDVDDLCNTEGVFTIDGLCENLKQELALTYVPVLASDFAVDVVKTNGGRAEVTWEAVPGADFYTVQVGHTVVDPISENVFISQVLAENNSIKVTLKNGTGKDINKDIAINYFLELTGYDKDGNVVVEPEVIKGDAINPDVWVSEKAVTKVFDAELSEDIIYEIRLCEYDTNRQIDIYTFDNTYSHLYRKTVDGGIILMNRGDFDTADWSTIKVEYPVADFEALATSAETTDTKVTVVEMAASSNYEVRVIAHSYCEKAQASRSELEKIHTSIDEGGSGKVAFEGIEAPTANESINAAGVQVFGGKGVVTVQGAAGKVITVANVLGQTLANQVAASDNVTIAVPAGIVVVAVDGDATKVVVK
ncbi:MAG: DUF6383 domain-containing protein [Parabacteroides sp.]|nr:DUF6383 domain-containing protein [Parabacteroides sp.]